MQLQIAHSSLELVQGDITKQELDAVVNAANPALAPGGGVAGAIHRAGGPELTEECRRIGRCETGDAVITTAGQMPARRCIHTVGPVWRGGESAEPERLASSYRRCLELAAENRLRSVGFPSISTGAYGYPIREAAEIALRTVKQFLEDNPGALEVVRFVLFSESDYRVYAEALQELA